MEICELQNSDEKAWDEYVLNHPDLSLPSDRTAAYYAKVAMDTSPVICLNL